MTCTADDTQIRFIAPDFEPLLDSFDLDILDTHRSCIYGIRKDLTLAYTNATWVRFAVDNNAPPQLIDANAVLNRSILEFLYGPMRSYYKTLYRHVLENNKPHTHEYECSSPELIRFYHMEILPLPPDSDDPQGLLIINSLSAPIQPSTRKNPVTPVDHTVYVDEHGQMTSCSNCRRFLRRDQTDMWDWIPCYLDDPPAPISHGICPVCLDYYYPNPNNVD